jgi:nucleoside-diphosphate-sugar epimerase
MSVVHDLVLVTGATGFIGGRLVDALVAKGARVRVATSNPKHGERLGARGIEVVEADLRDHAALARAAAGCASVFHVAYVFGGDEQKKVNLEGTRALAEAALQNNARRFVHFSSVAAYGPPLDGDLDERSPHRPSGGVYADTKHDIDAILMGMHGNRGLPVVILQPTIVHGPAGSTWTTPLIDQVKTRRVALPASGLGLCNAVYVDDVVAAALLANERDAAIGEAFLISGPSPVTWGEFYRAYEDMTGRTSVVALDDGAFDAEVKRRYGSNPLLQKIRRKLERLPLFKPPADALWLPDPGTRALYAAKTNVSIDKAREKLGYQPAFDLARGMTETARWRRDAGLLD